MYQGDSNVLPPLLECDAFLKVVIRMPIEGDMPLKNLIRA